MVLGSGGCAIFSNSHVRFLRQPEDENVQLGGSAAFLVQVTPIDATFQWLKNGVVITNATNSLLVIPNVSVSDVGFYTCRASASPSVTSRSAALTVYGAPSTSGSITTIPVTAPYSGSGSPLSGPCGNYLGVVRFPKPGSSPPSYGWTPVSNSVSGRLSDVTTGITGYTSTACVVQYSPNLRYCASGTRIVSFAVRKGTTYQFSVYVNAPNTIRDGTPVTGSVEWIQ